MYLSGNEGRTWEPGSLVRKENQALLAYPGTKDKLAQRELKETTDQQGLSVPKQMRVSKDHQVSQDHQYVHVVPFLLQFLALRLVGVTFFATVCIFRVDQVLPAKVEGKGSQASKGNDGAHGSQGSTGPPGSSGSPGLMGPPGIEGLDGKDGKPGLRERQALQAQQDREQSQDSKGKPAILASLDRRVNLDLQAPLDHQAGQDMMVTPGPQDLRADLDLPATLV
ncbi:hypothetical protein F7725_024834 [Dissostichus mawsoni]|uniref:Uncharacterized protein n=1 Tax=Dissostichus mawsoni TaxID=36200 RepID=A0A7J5X9E6_DISMA|nr:hypothetical protein F7725_024834 [Dissostichus mawsoni]